MSKIHVIGLQILCNTSKEGMLQKTESFLEEAVRSQKKTDLIVAPEMYYQFPGVTFEDEKFGEEAHGRFEQFWCGIARKYHSNVISGSYAVRIGNKIHNRALVIDREGNVKGYYDKIHVFDAFGEKESDWSEPGNTLGLFDLDIGKIGVMICYDLRFPEEARALAAKGARMLFVPAAFYQPRFDHWEILVRAASISNVCPVMAVNQSGMLPGGGKGFVGSSMLTDAEGRICSQASDQEGYFLGEIDLEFTKEAGKRNPACENKRMDLYKEWIQ